MDLSPDERHRLVLDPGKRLAPAPAPKRENVNFVCPKCKYPFSAPREYAMAVCKADEPPYVGENRGCGWLLGLEPPYARGSQGRAFAVIDMYVHPETGRVREANLFIEGRRRIIQEWERRGLTKTITDSEGNIIGHETPSVNDHPSEN